MGLLELNHVEKTRPQRDGGAATVLSDLCMMVPSRRVTVLIGSSGCGKTTLLRLINRLEEPTAGQVLLDGCDIAGIDPLQLRRQVVLVTQKPYMFQGSVLANLQSPFMFRNGKAPGPDSPLWLRSLAQVDLPGEFLGRRADRLSIGQQQRVSLARALLCEPRVVLLDEPTSALDRPASARFAETIRSLCRDRDMVLLLVTHDLWFAELVADQVAFLDEGRIVEEGPPERIFAAPGTPSLQRFLLRTA